MINNDRSLPVVLPQPECQFVSPYGSMANVLAIRKQMQMLIVMKCIEDPLFFFKYVSKWNEARAGS